MSWSRGADDGNGTGRLPTVGGGGNLYPLQHALAYLPNHDHWLDIVSATFPMLKLNGARSTPKWRTPGWNRCSFLFYLAGSSWLALIIAGIRAVQEKRVLIKKT